MANKKLAAALLLLVLGCGGAFGETLFWIGIPLTIGGLSWTVYKMGQGAGDYTGLYIAGAGCLLLLFDLVFFSDDSASAAQVKSGRVLQHVSLGVAPNAVYLGAGFNF